MVNLMAKTMISGEVPSDILDTLEINMHIPNLMALQIADETTPILFDLEWIILENHTNALFITSDNPVCLYNKLYVTRNYRRNYGLGTAGLIIILPISPKKCLCFYDPEVYSCAGSRIIRIKPRNVASEINRLLSANAYRNIFFNNLQEEKYIRNISKSYNAMTASEYVKSFNAVSINDVIYNDNEKHSLNTKQKGILFQIGEDCIHENFNLNFLEVRPLYKSIKLPEHMGGLTRAIAKNFQ